MRLDSEYGGVVLKHVCILLAFAGFFLYPAEGDHGLAADRQLKAPAPTVSIAVIKLASKAAAPDPEGGTS